MKYIGLFENFNETTENFIKHLIYWKFVNYLEYELTKLTDIQTMNICHIYVDILHEHIYTRNINKNNGEYNKELDLKTLKELYTEYGLNYTFIISSTFKNFDKILENIAKKIRKKFNVEDIQIDYNQVIITF